MCRIRRIIVAAALDRPVKLRFRRVKDIFRKVCMLAAWHGKSGMAQQGKKLFIG